MSSSPHAASHLAAAVIAELGREWIAAWNARDLERVLALYTEDFEMTSDRIPALGFAPRERCAARTRFAFIGRRRWSACPICISS